MNESSQPADLKTVEERVIYIARRMSRGQWLGGLAMRLDLAKAWDVCEQRVREYAAEAHRHLAIDPEQREDLRSEFFEFLRSKMLEASTDRNAHTGQLDYRAICELTETAAKFASIPLDLQQAPVQKQSVEIIVLDAKTGVSVSSVEPVLPTEPK